MSDEDIRKLTEAADKFNNPYFFKFLLYLCVMVIFIGVIVGIVVVMQQQQSFKNQEKMLADLQLLLYGLQYNIEQNSNITEEVLNVSNEHKQVAKDHDAIQSHIEHNLTEHRQNSEDDHKEILKKAQEIITAINSSSK